jgi:hypothetical protein
MMYISSYMSVNTLRIVYCSHLNSITNYGLPFWCNSPHGIKIFKMRKNIIRTMLGCKKRVSCRNVFRKFKILLLESRYILSLLLFVIKNKNQFIANLEIYSLDTRQHTNFHQPLSNLTLEFTI